MRSMRKLLALAVLLLPSLAHASGAITLTATTDTLELGTTTTATTDYTCSFVDSTASAFTPGSSAGQITTITETVIVAAPAASTQRKISGCSIHVVSGGTQTVTVQWDQSGTERIKFVAVLTTGWSLQWNEEGRFEVYDDTGRTVNVSQYDEDTAATAAERVTMAGVVRDDTPASLVNADGDRTEMQVDGTGRLWVNGSGVTQPVSGTVTVTATDLDVRIGGSDTVTVAATDLDIRNLNATDDIVQARGAAADGAAVTGNPVLIAGQDGTNAQSIKTDSTGSVQVDVETMPTTTVTATDLDIRNLNATDDIVQARGAAADGAAVTGNPVLVAGQDGTNAQSIKTDSTGSVQVDVETMPTTTVTATDLDVQIGGSDSLTIGTLPNEGQQTAANSISVTPDTDNDAVGAQGAAPPGEYVAIGGVTSGATGGFLNGIPVCTEFFAVDIVTATTTLAITGVSGRHVYICSISLVTAGANNVAIIAGTGATCGTSTAGLNGGTTAAEGWNFAANGGISQGTGLGAVMSTLASGGATGDSVCIITSAAVQLSGTIGYAIY